MSNQQWFVLNLDREEGPFTPQQLKQMAIEGKLTPSSKVRLGTMREFSLAAKVRGLFPELGADAGSKPTAATPETPAVGAYAVRDARGGDSTSSTNAGLRAALGMPADSVAERAKQCLPAIRVECPKELRSAVRGHLIGELEAGALVVAILYDPTNPSADDLKKWLHSSFFRMYKFCPPTFRAKPVDFDSVEKLKKQLLRVQVEDYYV